jgi:hypothetical protein
VEVLQHDRHRGGSRPDPRSPLDRLVGAQSAQTLSQPPCAFRSCRDPLIAGDIPGTPLLLGV